MKLLIEIHPHKDGAHCDMCQHFRFENADYDSCVLFQMNIYDDIRLKACREAEAKAKGLEAAK